jgi:hypothetical protein
VTSVKNWFIDDLNLKSRSMHVVIALVVRVSLRVTDVLAEAEAEVD